jgi:DNA repair protein RadA/Sms
LQLADSIGRQLEKGRRVLYVSGEESVDQVGMRASRLKTNESSFSNVDIMNQPNLNHVLGCFTPDSPHGALIVDSIQTIFMEDTEGDTGGVIQIRSCALACVHMAKSSGVPVILIG